MHKHALAVSSEDHPAPIVQAQSLPGVTVNHYRPHVPSIELWISATILSALSATASRKFIFHPPKTPQSVGGTKPKPILLWIITPDTYISSMHMQFEINGMKRSGHNSNPHAGSNRPSNKAHRAMKVLYRYLHTEEEANSALLNDVEELELDETLGKELADKLWHRRWTFPYKLQRMGEWDVSWLWRFQRSDLERDNAGGDESGS